VPVSECFIFETAERNLKEFTESGTENIQENLIAVCKCPI
jgi:hypothetical protein